KVELDVSDAGFCKVLKDPALDKSFHIESFLPFTEIAKLKRGNANVRPPEQGKRPFKAMINTVEFNPGMFQIMNRGITYICSNADYDEQTGKLVVTIPDSSELRRQSDGNVLRYGIADGGHTFE